jgi:hypothetical protein
MKKGQTKMKTALDVVPKAGTALQIPANLQLVQESAGLVGRYLASRAIGKEASRTLVELKTAFIQAEERIGKTQIGVAEAKVKGALIAEAMGSIGALAVDVASRVGVVQSALTASAAAERVAHVENRAASYFAIDAALAQKRLSMDESVALKSYADADLVTDIERANTRMIRSKEAVERFHNLALDGLSRATQTIR